MHSFLFYYFGNEIFFMQQSLTVSIEQESSSLTIAHNSSENSWNKINKVNYDENLCK